MLPPGFVKKPIRGQNSRKKIKVSTVKDAFGVKSRVFIKNT